MTLMPRLGRTWLASLRRDTEGVKREFHHLWRIGSTGEAAATPLITAGLVALFLVPVFGLMLGAALLAYYVIG